MNSTSTQASTTPRTAPRAKPAIRSRPPRRTALTAVRINQPTSAYRREHDDEYTAVAAQVLGQARVSPCASQCAAAPPNRNDSHTASNHDRVPTTIPMKPRTGPATPTGR